MDASPALPTYLWQVPAKPVSVTFNFDFVDRLGMAVLGGFKSLPRRGLETGGILLGRERKTEDGILVEIATFDPVECEHAFGPSYLLSAADRKRLAERIAWHRSRRGHTVVGFYRSHTRKEFALTPEDTDLMSELFSRESNVFLLLQCNGELPPTAGFAMWEGKKIRSAVPHGIFEFTRASLTASGTVTVAAPAAEAVEAALSQPQATAEPSALAAAPPPAPRVPVRSRISRPKWRLRVPAQVDWGWLAAAAIVTVTLMLAAVLRNDGNQPRPRVPLGLDVRHEGAALRLVWNRDASVVRTASRGILRIGDGARQETLDLTPAQLGAGSLMYFPRSSDVNFQMDVFSPAAHDRESLRAVGAPPPAPVPKLLADLPALPPEKPSPFTFSDKPERRATGQADRVSRPAPTRRLAREEPRTPTVARPAAPIVAPAPKPVPAKVSQAPLPATAALHGEPAPAAPPPVKTVPHPHATAPPLAPALVSVEAEPVHEAPRVGLLARLHLTSRHKDRPDFVPPEPVHHPALAIPPDLRARARMESPINVRVYVDRTGRVEYAELESEATETDRDLAALAVFSSRRWQFVPAHIGDRKVPGEVLLRYRFGTR